MVSEQDIDTGNGPAEVDDERELAVARLAWAKDAHCLDIPEQARAVEWHVAACDETAGAEPADGDAHA